MAPHITERILTQATTTKTSKGYTEVQYIMYQGIYVHFLGVDCEVMCSKDRTKQIHVQLAIKSGTYCSGPWKPGS